jgi:hypothetical protein
MREKFFIIALSFLSCMFLISATAYAGGNHNNSCEGYKGKLLNRCHEVIHPEREDPAGVGADILVHETENLDLVAEYKYDVNNEEHSIFGVFKTKKSLVEYAKALINKVKGEDVE